MAAPGRLSEIGPGGTFAVVHGSVQRRIRRTVLVLQLCLSGASATSCGSDREPNRNEPTGSAGNGGTHSVEANAGTGGAPGGAGSAGVGNNGGGNGGANSHAGAPGSASVQFVLKEVH